MSASHAGDHTRFGTAPRPKIKFLKVQGVTEAARSNLSIGEFQELEELAEHEDIVAVDREDRGPTNKVYNRRDTGDIRPIHQRR
jgi:hypothetical protein